MTKLTFSTLSNNTVNNNNEVKPMTINLDLIRARKANESMITNAIKTMNKLNNQLAVLTTKISELQQFKVVSNTKARRLSDSPKAVVKQPKVRKPGSVKPARITIAHCPLVSSKTLRSFGACGVFNCPSNDIKLTDLNTNLNTTPKTMVDTSSSFVQTLIYVISMFIKTTQTNSTIMIDLITFIVSLFQTIEGPISVDNLIPNKFFMEAKSMLDNTKNNLPQVAQSMVMQMNDIDAEFGINNTAQPNGVKEGTTNNPQEDESMTTSNEALNLLNNMPKLESTKSTTNSMFDNLDSDVTFEYKQTTDGEAVTGKVKGLPMDQYDFNHFSTYGNPNAPKTLTLFFNMEHRLVSWKSPVSGRASQLNQRMLQVVEVAKPNDKGMLESTAVVTPINTDTQAGFTAIIRAIAKTINACPTVAQAEERLEALLGTLFIKQWEEDDQRANQYNVAAIVETVGNVHDAQAVARRNEIAAFHVNDKGVILNRADRMKLVLRDEFGKLTHLRGSANVWVKGCLEEAIAQWGFCFSDKTNSKRAYCGDALQAIAGLSEDGMRSLVVSDKEGKTFARHAMCKHISAVVPNASRDNFYGEMANNQFAGHYGHQITTTYVDNSIFSTVVGDGGAVLRKPLTGTITKRLDASFNLLQLRASNSDLANASIEVIETKITEHLCSIGTLAPGEVVMFEGQQILQNKGLAVTVKPQKLIPVQRKYSNTEVSTIEFTLKGETTITDFNWKLRLLWIKAMTVCNADIQLKNLEVQGDLILNANSVKNKKFMLLRMWANHFGHLIAFCKDGTICHLTQDDKGNLVKGAEVDEAQVQADLDAITKTAELTFVAHKVTVDNHKADNAKAYADAKISGPDADGNVTVTVKVKTITAPIVVALELSSVAENRVISGKASQLISDFATTFEAAEDVGSSTIRREATRQANIVELCLSDEVNQSFDISDDNKSELQEILKALFAKNHTPAAFFKALAQKFPKGIEIKGHAGKLRVERAWNVILPTQLLSVHGRFNKAGFSHDAKVGAVFAFLSMIASAKVGNNAAQSIADCAFKLRDALEFWKQDVVSGKGTLTKTSLCFEQHGFKVIATAKDAYQEIAGHNVPVIFLSETNPLTQVAKGKKSMAIGKDGRNAKVVRTGDVVFFYRNPLVQLGVAVIKVVGEDVVGPYAAAIAPDAFALNNAGDHDGDAINIIPASQFGIRNLNTPADKLTDVSVTPADQVESLMEHPLLELGLADKAIQAYSGGKADKILAGICEVTGFKIHTDKEMLKVDRKGQSWNFPHGLVLDRTEQMEQFNLYAEPNDDGTPITFAQVWVEDAEATAWHYSVRVGQGYTIMFNAVSHFVAKYRENNPLSGKDLLAVMASSVYVYEHIGLSGYSSDNKEAFELLEAVANEELGGKQVTVSNLRSYQPISMCTGTVETKGDLNPQAYTIKPAAKFFAMTMIQSKVERKGQAGLMSHPLFADACKYAAFRSLTKGMYSNPTKISNALRCAKVDGREPYAPLLEVLVAHAKQA